MKSFFHVLLCTSLLLIANPFPAVASASLPYKVIAERTHKPTLFTQGLLVDDGLFYESSGLYNQSLLVSYPVAEPTNTWAKISAPFTKKLSLPGHYFAEGLALHNGKLYLLTWQEKTLLVYDKATMVYEKSITYEGEGWGLTSNGKELIRSDGSDNLFFHNSADFTVIKTLKVTDSGASVSQLNELEYAQGFIWANIWHQDQIIKIDPETGNVVGKIDLADLKKTIKLDNSEQVLNGIAWDEEREAFWITGKFWPKMFLIHITH